MLTIGGRHVGHAKAFFSRLLNKEFRHYRATRAHDGQGGFEETMQKIGTFKGRMSITGRTSSEIGIGAKWPAEVDTVLFVEPMDMQRQDEVEVDGRRWRVVAVNEPSLMGHHMEVGCKELQK